ELASCVSYIEKMAKQRLGLNLRLNKCSYITPSGNDCPSLSQLMRHSKDGLNVLGSPVGNDQYCVEFCKREVLKYKKIFVFIEQLTKQERFLVLKNSLDCGMTYLLRTTP